MCFMIYGRWIFVQCNFVFLDCQCIFVPFAHFFLISLSLSLNWYSMTLWAWDCFERMHCGRNEIAKNWLQCVHMAPGNWCGSCHSVDFHWIELETRIVLFQTLLDEWRLPRCIIDQLVCLDKNTQKKCQPILFA